RENTRLDDILPRWTSDGRYVYYVDVDVTQKGGAAEQVLSRVWDVQQGKVVATIPRVQAVAPGPGSGSMVLRTAVERSLGYALHVIDRKASYPIDPPGALEI